MSKQTSYFEPIGVGLFGEQSPGAALPLAGGPMGFTGLREWTSDGPLPSTEASLAAFADSWPELADFRHPLTAPRADFAGLAVSSASAMPLVMGIVNVTPNSFSDGGDHYDVAAAIAHGKTLAAAGADIIDVGGESTRPGAADELSIDEECARVLPVIEGLANSGPVVSIDTRRGPVMAAAIAAGARIVNDVSALSDDQDAANVIASSGASVILMHKRGQPATMQDTPEYHRVETEIYDYLAARVEFCEHIGIGRDRIAIDPGIGFGKSVAHNLALISHLGLLHGIGVPITIGASRKSFIATATGPTDPKQRLGGSLAAALAAAARGAQILRVHDVAATVQALSLWRQLGG